MQNNRRFFLTLLVAFFLAASVWTGSAQAQEMSRPLMVVRFNQPRVYYDQQLYMAVSQAVAAKPDVMFNVVSFAPATGDSDRDQKWQGAAGQHTQQVVANLQRIGVPLERIRITGQSEPGIRYDETRIYVR